MAQRHVRGPSGLDLTLQFMLLKGDANNLFDRLAEVWVKRWPSGNEMSVPGTSWLSQVQRHGVALLD